MRLLFFSWVGALQLFLFFAKLLGYVPSWSAVLFWDAFFFGFFKLVDGFFFKQELAFKRVWGVFFIFLSLALLGQEYSFWHFWTVENSFIITALIFSLALCMNTLFLKNDFSRVLFLVPGLFLFILALLALLALYRYFHQSFLIPLWQVNLFVLFLALLFGLGQVVFFRRKVLLKFLRSL